MMVLCRNHSTAVIVTFALLLLVEVDATAHGNGDDPTTASACPDCLRLSQAV